MIGFAGRLAADRSPGLISSHPRREIPPGSRGRCRLQLVFRAPPVIMPWVGGSDKERRR